MARPDKAAAVAELAEEFRSSAGAVLTDYRGLTVKQLQDLRRVLGDGASYAVVKNTLTKIAADEAGLSGFDDLLVGPTAIAFIKGDVVEVAKGLRDFARTNPPLIIKGGILDGQTLSIGEIAKIADLESREVLLGRMAGALLASIQNAAYMFNEPLAKAARLAGALQAKAEGDPSVLAGGAGVPDQPDAATSSDDTAPEPAPVGEVPALETPIEEAPAPDTAVAEAPAPDTAVAEAPALETPLEAAPAPDTAVAEAPAPDTAVADDQAAGAPASDTALAEAPAAVAPATDTAVAEAPAPDTAVAEAPAPDTAVADDQAAGAPATDTALAEAPAAVAPATDTAAGPVSDPADAPATDTPAADSDAPVTDTAAAAPATTESSDTTEG